MGIIIGADVVPTAVNVDLFSSGDVDALVGAQLRQYLFDADYRIVNLEVPLCDKKEPIAKCGPHLIAPTATVNGYASLGVNMVTLANNHILDQGIQGANSTIKRLDSVGIRYVGFGDEKTASAPQYFVFGDRRIGVFACAEHEFSIVDNTHEGSNPINLLEISDQIVNAKENCDYLIVLYHGGKEHYRYPSPQLQKICRKIVSKGANLVICQHSHCVGCEEKYENGVIVYGQGNFIFNKRDNEYWNTALLVEVNHSFEVNYIPICRTETGTRMAIGAEADQILSDFNQRSAELLIPEYIENRYEEFAEEMLNYYLKSFMGKRSKLSKGIDRLSAGRNSLRLIRKKYKATEILRMIDFIKCEAHNELLLTGLIGYIDKDKMG